MTKPDTLRDWRRRIRPVELTVIALYAISLSFPITYGWVMLVIGIVVWVASFLLTVAADSVGGEKPIRSAIVENLKIPPLTVPILVFVLCATISGGLAGGVKEAFATFVSFRSLLAYFWAYQLFSDDQKMRITAVEAALCMGAIGGIWGTIEQVANIHPTDYPYLQGTGFMFSPMSFSGLMQILAMLAMGLLLHREGAYKRFHKILWISMDSFLRNRFNADRILHKILSQLTLFAAVAISNVLGVIFALERGGWMGAFVGAIVVLASVSFKALLRASVLFVVLAAIAWITIPAFHKRLDPALADWRNDVSIRVRVQVWAKAIDLFKEKPVFGVGVRKFPHLDIPEAVVPGHSDYIDHAHSNYLQILATMGAVGLIAYLYLCCSILLLCIRCMKEQGGADAPFDHGVALGLLGGMVSLMVAGLFEYNFGTGQVRLAQWFFLALLIRRRS